MIAAPFRASDGSARHGTPDVATPTKLIEVLSATVCGGIAPWTLKQEGLLQGAIGAIARIIALQAMSFVGVIMKPCKAS